MDKGVDEFVYKLPGTSSGSRPGAHHSHSRGSGMTFAAHARLFDQPDPRRLDLRASLNDIRGDWLVRTHLQRSSITVHVILDISTSMSFGHPGKMQVAADFLRALGHSAHSYGDFVSLLPFDRDFREDFYLPPRSGRVLTHTLDSSVEKWTAHMAVAGNGEGLADAIRQVAGKQGLVFIVSDFHWPLEGLDSALDLLSAATVVPVVVWDQAEVYPPPAGNLLSVRDLETGRFRSLWLRKRTRDQWLDNVARRRTDIAGLFARHDCSPFHIEDGFQSEKLSRYFMERTA